MNIKHFTQRSPHGPHPRIISFLTSSPLIALAGVNRLNLLPRLYSRVIAPSAVIDEILAGGQKASGLNFLDRVSWLEHRTVEQTPELISIALGPNAGAFL